MQQTSVVFFQSVVLKGSRFLISFSEQHAVLVAVFLPQNLYGDTMLFLSNLGFARIC